MQGAMKLRKIGNSLGTTFSKDVLQKAGFTGDEALEVVASPGEIRLRRASGRIVIELTEAEANALAAGDMDAEAAVSALAKVRAMVTETFDH